jgi:hypothetical protein
VWPGIRTWMRSAGTYPYLRRKENPGGCTGYPENHWDSFFVSPKHGKGMGLTSRWQVSVLAVNWPLDPSELSGLFIKAPCEIL